jgi:hypothetical protein
LERFIIKNKNKNNMTQIKPIVFPLQEGTATQLEVTILAFTTSATTTSTYNRLLDENGNQVGASWNYYLTEAQYAEWGFDNSVVDGFVAADKGIEILENKLEIENL